MPTIRLNTFVKADIETCFDLSRSIDLHVESTKHTRETAIAGRTSGLIELGDTVTWRARHFGIWQTLTSKITVMQRPVLFVDEMQSGAFKSFRHEHHFGEAAGGTLMTDIFIFEAPLGLLGAMANKLFLTKYMRKLLIQRNEVIKLHAELKQK
ncbi:cell division protein [Mucilaginibacter sp. PPCGB 2223]|uniref:SRPBCC family protein n=1 Tax=Mucilaginibacter sp. PPCGB 2223 TaxID=1886027 RepID=UPI00082552B5|nr:SRPBCC family protein [Mucilaginibacter sp. PPCGB 2223]OCX52598.1 cell division protein [Mucilaginibacter sp. PPCGB 2223]